MTEKPYGRKVAESLLSPTGTNNYWVIDDQGLWPKGEWNPALGTGNRIDFELESWRPAVMFATDSLPQAPGDLPALPFPFDAKDLTAFMLAGFGALVADHYGDWENGPNPERIDELNPLDFSRRAVKEAFESYREALKIVGPYPLELGAKADRAREAWSVANAEANQREGVSDSKPGTEDSKARGERAKASIVPQDLEMEATAAEAKAAEEKWLEAMVRELLEPVQKFKLNVTTNEPAVVDEIDYKMMATRTQLIDAFGSFTGMDLSWFNNLNDVPKLKNARKHTGKSGRNSFEPLFCPYEVMQWLADPRRKKGRELGEEAAWRLLKRNFPNVYNQYSIGDPNNV